MLLLYSLKYRSLATSSSLLAAVQVFIRNFSAVAFRVRRERWPVVWSMVNSESLEACWVDPIFKYIKYVISQMIKPKSSVSPFRTTKKSLRPHSSGNPLPRKPAASLITNIISSLQQNVKDLKTYYHSRQLLGGNRGQKSQKGFRVKRTLVRNSSQSNLNARGDKSQQDIFEIRNEYLRVHGRLSNNISELYEFYRKNQEKREKSTRILASMEFSNGGQSVSGGKESLLKHSQLFNHRENSRREIQEQRIDEANEDSHQQEPPVQPKSPLKPRKSEKTSELASELLSKGCYNIMNIANLLNCKKYRLTKEKEESFKKPKEKSKPDVVEMKEQISNENNMNTENMIKAEEGSAKNSSHKQEPMAELLRSPQIRNRPDFSFKKNTDNCVASSGKSFECSSISKKEKDLDKDLFEDTSNKKDFNGRMNKGLIELEESPILAKNNKQFEKSKYYVKPIPLPNKASILDQKSISLRSSSKLIDIDSIPFDL